MAAAAVSSKVASLEVDKEEVASSNSNKAAVHTKTKEASDSNSNVDTKISRTSGNHNNNKVGHTRTRVPDSNTATAVGSSGSSNNREVISTAATNAAAITTVEETTSTAGAAGSSARKAESSSGSSSRADEGPMRSSRRADGSIDRPHNNRAVSLAVGVVVVAISPETTRGEVDHTVGKKWAAVVAASPMAAAVAATAVSPSKEEGTDQLSSPTWTPSRFTASRPTTIECYSPSSGLCRQPAPFP